MVNYRLRAWSITKEFELNALAQQMGLARRITWEEPLTLDSALLRHYCAIESAPDTRVFLFAFGSVVLVNGDDLWMPTILRFLADGKFCQQIFDWRRYTDDFLLEEGSGESASYEDDRASFPTVEPYHLELTAVVLAKTVALERNEAQLERILETAEGILDRLDTGRTRMSQKKLSSLTARVLRHEYDSISYTLILDKPDVTWVYPDAWEYYEKLSEVFELSDRYETIRQKTETLRHIIDGFTVINHSVRGMFVEWVIVLLILAEIVLMVLEYLK